MVIAQQQGSSFFNPSKRVFDGATMLDGAASRRIIAGSDRSRRRLVRTEVACGMWKVLWRTAKGRCAVIASICAWSFQRRNSRLFVVPPVLQGGDLIPRRRLHFFRASARGKWCSFSAKPRFLRSPRGDRAPLNDDELLVRASAVLKSQGPENWPRGRPGAPFNAISAFWTQKPAVFNGARSNYFSRYRRELR